MWESYVRRSLSARLSVALAAAVLLFVGVVVTIVNGPARTGRLYEQLPDRDVAAQLLTRHAQIVLKTQVQEFEVAGHVVCSLT